MRIFISTDTVGGVWDYAATLARELSSRGHQVLLAALNSPSEARLSQLPAKVEVVWQQYRLEWMQDAASDVTACGDWLAEVARRWEPDVVHLNQMAYTARDFGAPTVVVVHSDVLSWFSETRGVAAPPEWEAYASWVRRGIAAADVLVTPSEYQSRLCGEYYGRQADRIIHNGVAAPELEPAERTASLVLTVGRAWDEAKGMAVLDEAIGLLGDKAPDTHLFGEELNPDGNRFDAKHLIRHGRVERAAVDRWMAHATLYVGASLYEPFGLAPLEAALNGCALLMSDIPSFRELWDGCAHFFPKGDATALANALLEIESNPAYRAELASAARQRALDDYGVDRFGDNYAELYEEMLPARV